MRGRGRDRMMVGGDEEHVENCAYLWTNPDYDPVVEVR